MYKRRSSHFICLNVRSQLSFWSFFVQLRLNDPSCECSTAVVAALYSRQHKRVAMCLWIVPRYIGYFLWAQVYETIRAITDSTHTQVPWTSMALCLWAWVGNACPRPLHLVMWCSWLLSVIYYLFRNLFYKCMFLYTYYSLLEIRPCE